MADYHLAYIFERFPTFTQTFCVREILELHRQGVKPLIFSIHDTSEEQVQHYPKELMQYVQVLPPREQLIQEVRQLREDKKLCKPARLVLAHWDGRPDKNRVYEAAWIYHKMESLGALGTVKHVHSHFAGLGARTCWWLRKFSGLSFSFTAHANDIFCDAGQTTPTIDTLMNDAALIVTVSEYTAKNLRQAHPEAANRVVKVYNGLDLTPFMEARQKAPRLQVQGNLLSVGRLIEKKGYDDLIQACSLLKAQGIPFACKIVGEGPLEGELRSQIEALGLGDQIELTGPKSINDILDLLANWTQIFALACKTEKDGGKDNLPTVIMEAMATSLPCVSTILAGVPEMIVDGKTGFVTEEGDPQAFANSLAKLIQNPALAEDMGRAGLEHAKVHFAKENTSHHLIRAFGEQGDLVLEGDLATRFDIPRGFLRKLGLGLPKQLRHSLPKLSSKSFNLLEFMKSA